MHIDLQFALTQAVAAAKAPGAVAYAGSPEGPIFTGAAGSRRLLPDAAPATLDTPYDIASLTKVVATTTAAMLLWESGQLDLDAPVAEYLPFPAFRAFTPRHLLTHTTGLPSGIPLYYDVQTSDQAVARIAQTPVSWAAGARRRYSDLGFILLGKVIESATGERLDRFCTRRIFAPLNMQRTGYNPHPMLHAQCAATEQCPWRGRLICGEVHDENAYAMGGVSGHAGVFATAGDLAKFCTGILDGRILKTETLAAMIRLGQVPAYPWQGLGWKIDPWRDGSEGYLPSRAAFGHTGWTGTSIWVDFDTGLHAILLSNTCHPSRAHRENRTLRRVFHTAVHATCYPGRSNAHTGLDRLVWDEFAPIKGKRIAVLTHMAAVDQLGRPLLDVLALEPEIILRAIYSPEHGLRGQAEAGAAVKSQAAAVPVISLYGDRKRPTQDELRGVELFVVDLQDVGARFYTYAATMKECMAACAAAGVPMLILDRPNPLGGTVLEGPLPGQTNSLVCAVKAPTRHGLTLGEIALLFWRTEFSRRGFEVRVHAVDGWAREQRFESLPLPWTPPSPNIPAPEIALLYSGLCLFEGVTINEGRGTDTPFQVIGAPWLAPADILAALPAEALAGCTLEAVRYTPRAMPGKAADPRFRDTDCAGIRIQVTDGDQIRPFTLAVALLQAIHRRHSELEWLPYFDTLAGGETLRHQIQSGAPIAELIRGFDAANRTWARTQNLRYAPFGQWLSDDRLI